MDYMFFFQTIASSSWHLFVDAAPYILFGIVIGGMLKMFLSPQYVANHLGKGKFMSVFKSALFGIPIPL